MVDVFIHHFFIKGVMHPPLTKKNTLFLFTKKKQTARIAHQLIKYFYEKN